MFGLRVALTTFSLTLVTTTAAWAAPAWPDLQDSGAPVGGGGADAAVIVGIERYAAAPAVPGAVDNAREWYAWLSRSRGIPVDRMQLLTDRYGTVERMRKALATAATQVEPGGTLWFVYVGHGAPARTGDDGIFVGFDAQQDPDSLYARSLPQKEALALLSARPAGSHTVFVVDACFSGRSGSGGPLVEGLQPLLPVAKEARPDAGVTILSAGAADQFAGPLPGLERPAFSYLTLGALRGWADDNRDGRVTASEVVGYTRSTLQAVVRGRQQTPELNGQDLVLSPAAVEAGPDIAGVVLDQTTEGGDATIRAATPVRRVRTFTTIPGHDAFAVDLTYQFGTNDDATVHAIDLGVQGTLGAIELIGRVGYAFGTEHGISEMNYDNATGTVTETTRDRDLEAIHLAADIGLKLLSWKDPDFHELSLVNLSIGVAGEGIISPDTGGGFNVGAYVANTFYFSCDAGARVSYTKHFLPADVSGPVPSSLALTFGLLSSREGCY